MIVSLAFFLKHHSQLCCSRLVPFLGQLAVVLTFSMFCLAKASADYYDGLRAFDSGDYASAAQEWLLAGSHGDAGSQFRLAQLYEQGLGVPQDFVQAHRWYNIAASQGHAEARSTRDALSARLTADQLAEAQRLATQTGALPQVNLQEPAIPSVQQEAAITAADISRFNGRWSATGYAKPKLKCGHAVVNLRIHDGQVEGNLRLIVGRWQDGADGVYKFAGVIDQNGNIRTSGDSVSFTGTIIDSSSIRGSFVAAASECKGTSKGQREF